MAISSPGVGSGLDVRSIVSQLVALERQPIQQLQSKASGLQAKLSAFGRIKSELAGLQDAAASLLDSSTWKGRTFSSSNTAAVTGSASTSALASSFSVQVIGLAQVQSARSGAYTTGAALGSSGRLDIQVGEWSGNTFSGGSNPVLSVSVASTDTLSDVATKINSADAGVTAVVVRNGTEERLLVRGDDTGSSAGYRIRAYNDSSTEITTGTGLGALAYAYNGTAFYGLGQTQAAQNASLTVDGITVTSKTNTVSDAVPGVTLNLLATTTSAAQITVGVDKDSVKKKIEAFQTAYNKLSATLADLSKTDPSGNADGPLQGDGTVRGLQSMLKNLVGTNGPAGTTLGRLSDMGLQMQRDGSLSLNSTKLNSAMDNLSDLETFLATSSGNSATDGIARRIRDFAFGANSSDGSVSGRNTALQNAISRNSKEIERLNERVTRTEARLYAQYSRLDANIGSINSLGSFVTQQLAQWNKSS